MCPPSRLLLRSALLIPPLLLHAACGVARNSGGGDDAGLTAETSGAGASDGQGASAGQEGGDDGARLDVGSARDLPEDGFCRISHDPDATQNGVGNCEQVAPPDAFEPEIQWAFESELMGTITPLVANLTDDNGDGSVDLCDVPDVVLVGSGGGSERVLLLLDGETGAEHWRSSWRTQNGTPAIGDLDGDRVPEIITSRCVEEGYPVRENCKLVAVDGEGNVKWEGPEDIGAPVYGHHFALGDADNDGDVEILATHRLLDHEGEQLFRIEGNLAGIPVIAPALADLDGDEDLEIVLGNEAYHHDGSLYWEARIPYGFPQLADLDEDGLPEVLVTNRDGLSVLEHDGRLKYSARRPTGVAGEGLNWLRPASVHDFDGDGKSEYASASGREFSVYEPDATMNWTAEVVEISGISTSTAFDFLGDGTAEAMYADEGYMFVYGGEGEVLMQIERTSGTVIDYPIVVDVDNDGSAEILVVSESVGRGFPDGLPGRDRGYRSPFLQVIRDVDERWIQARRIWNQHTYHVTNVREDGTIPQVEPPHWKELNTFRTQAQIEGGSVCRPMPVG